MKLDVPKVVLILGTLAILATVSCWLIATDRMPPDGLVKILGAIFAIAGAVATPVAAYMKGKNELPTWLTDPVKLSAAHSFHPPPLPHDLEPGDPQ